MTSVICPTCSYQFNIEGLGEEAAVLCPECGLSLNSRDFVSEVDNPDNDSGKPVKDSVKLIAPLKLNTSRKIAIGCGVVSVLFGGQVGMLLSLILPGQSNLMGLVCVVVMSAVPLLTATGFWRKPRIGIFIAFYGFGLAGMTTLYMVILSLPILFPEFKRQLEPENQEFID